MDFLLDGTITKSDYTAKMDDMAKQIALLNEKEIRVQEKKEEKGELLERLDKVRALFQNKTEKGIAVPLMCAHIKQIKVYENRLDIYLDFLKEAECLTVSYEKTGRKGSYDMPIWVGGHLP